MQTARSLPQSVTTSRKQFYPLPEVISILNCVTPRSLVLPPLPPWCPSLQGVGRGGSSGVASQILLDLTRLIIHIAPHRCILFKTSPLVLLEWKRKRFGLLNWSLATWWFVYQKQFTLIKSKFVLWMGYSLVTGGKLFMND